MSSLPPNLPSVTTAQQDLTTAVQRRISLIWEYTQASIAILITLANVVVSTAMSLNKVPLAEYPMVLSSSFFLIVGFYFSRTNPSTNGSTNGYKPSNP